MWLRSLILYVSKVPVIYLTETYIYARKKHIHVSKLLMQTVEFFATLSLLMAKGKAYEAIVIGHQIRYLRRIKDMSQKTLAQKIGVSVGRIERGLFLPNLKLLFKIAKALQVKVKDLFPNEL